MSAAKDVSKRGSAQPAMAPSAEAQLAALLSKFAPTDLALIGDVRRWLRERLPAANEVVYEYKDCAVISYSPSARGYEGILAIRTHSDGVRLYFTQGKELRDPAKLLKGAAKARWLMLDDASTLARPEVLLLVEQAIARNTIPFDPVGGGSIIIRSASDRS